MIDLTLSGQSPINDDYSNLPLIVFWNSPSWLGTTDYLNKINENWKFTTFEESGNISKQVSINDGFSWWGNHLKFLFR